MAVLGVDACKAGWVGVRIDGSGPPVAFCRHGIADLVEAAGAVNVVAIDIPIGLPSAGSRLADGAARAVVGRRSSSVFTTPPRAALEAATYEEAAIRCRQLTGGGLSKQSFALARKVLEVDGWIVDASVPVVEVHPEVSFAVLAGAALAEPKSTWAGFMLRRRLLAGAGIVLGGHLGLAGRRVGPDDVLDAAVAAWTAGRVALGEHVSFPDPPELLGDGRRAAIVA